MLPSLLAVVRRVLRMWTPLALVRARQELSAFWTRLESINGILRVKLVVRPFHL